MEALAALDKAKLNIQFNTLHKYYNEAIALRKFYLQCITGDNVDSLLPQFERREEPELWKQRQALTLENLSPTVAPVLNKFYKVARVAPRKKINVTDKGQLKILEEIEAKFYAENDVENYLATIVDDYSQYDPNAFLMVDFEPFAPGQSATPYPVIFNCDEVLDFHYTRKGILDYVFTKYETTIYDQASNKSEQVKDYYMIVEGVVYHFQQEQAYRKYNEADKVLEVWTAPGQVVKYRIIRKDKASKKVVNNIQAKRIGYIKSKSYPSICIAPLHPAKPHLKDMIRLKSGYDLSMLLHIFPQRYQYGDPCPGEVEKNANWVCVEGHRGSKDGPICKKCKGSGFRIPRSAQDTTYLRWPKGDEKVMALKDMVYYHAPELGVVTAIDQRLEDLEGKVYVAVFSSDIHRQATGGAVEDSATKVNVKKDDINDTLLPYSQQRANLYKFILQCAAQFNDIKADTVFEYPKQFEVESVQELLDKIGTMNTANVSEIIVQEIELMIAKQQFDNDPDALRRYTLQRRFLPFKGKSETIITGLMAANYVPDKIKALYANFNLIFEELEGTDQGKVFYAKDYTAQLAEVYVIAERLLEEAKSNVPVIPLNSAAPVPAQKTA